MITNVYIIRRDGLPLVSWGLFESHPLELISGFLSAILSFSAEMGSKKLNLLDFGDKKFIFKIESDLLFVLVVTDYSDFAEGIGILDLIASKFQEKYTVKGGLNWDVDMADFKNFGGDIARIVKSPVARVQEELFELCSKHEIKACATITIKGSTFLHAESSYFSEELKPIIDFVAYFIKGHKILRRGQPIELFFSDDISHVLVFHVIKEVYFLVLGEKRCSYASIRRLINPVLNKLSSAFERVSPDFFCGLQTQDIIDSFLVWANETYPFSSLDLDFYDVIFEPLIPHNNRFIHFDAILQYGENFIFLKVIKGTLPASDKDVEQMVLDVKSMLDDKKLLMVILLSSKGFSKDAIIAAKKLSIKTNGFVKFVTLVTVENGEFKIVSYRKLTSP
ncbi:MAG: hypothetical protein ACFE68_01765 [Candidatus Hodarchaeota archaeon]